MHRSLVPKGVFAWFLLATKGCNQQHLCRDWAPKHRWCIRLIGTKHAGFGWVPRQHSPTIFWPTRWNNGWQRFPQGALSNTCAGNGSHPEVDKVLGSIVTWQLQFVYMLKNMVHLVLLPNIYLHILLVSLQLSEILGSSRNIQRSWSLSYMRGQTVDGSAIHRRLKRTSVPGILKSKNDISKWQSTTVNYV